MNVQILKSKACGQVTAPPSKSYAHRLLICAGLSDGVSVIENVALSDDIKATLNCLSALGVKHEINGDTVTVYGKGKNITVADAFRCNESGSTLRFFIPIALTSGADCRFCGTEKLISRGIGIYKDLLRDCAEFNLSQTDILASGKLACGNYKINGNVSSQFISGMFFALPLLEGDSTVEIIPPVESRSYINVTVDVLKQFGIEILQTYQNCYYIKGNQRYNARNLAVEGDWSNSAFLLALNELGGNVRVIGLNKNSFQGDKIVLKLFDELNKERPVIDISDCPDLAPVLFAVASTKNGATFSGTKRLAIKESDRATAMAKELEKFGITVTVEENSVKILPSQLKKPKVALYGHNDHRIVMSMAVLSTLFGATVEGAQAVKKSYPNFFDVLQSLNVEIKYDT